MQIYSDYLANETKFSIRGIYIIINHVYGNS